MANIILEQFKTNGLWGNEIADSLDELSPSDFVFDIFDRDKGVCVELFLSSERYSPVKVEDGTILSQWSSLSASQVESAFDRWSEGASTLISVSKSKGVEPWTFEEKERRFNKIRLQLTNSSVVHESTVLVIPSPGVCKLKFDFSHIPDHWLTQVFFDAQKILVPETLYAPEGWTPREVLSAWLAFGAPPKDHSKGLRLPAVPKKTIKPRKAQEKDKEAELLKWLDSRGVFAEQQVISKGRRTDIWLPGKFFLELKVSKANSDDVCQALDYYSVFGKQIILVAETITEKALRGIEAANKLAGCDALAFVTWRSIKQYLAGMELPNV